MKFTKSNQTQIENGKLSHFELLNIDILKKQNKNLLQSCSRMKNELQNLQNKQNNVDSKNSSNYYQNVIEIILNHMMSKISVFQPSKASIFEENVKALLMEINSNCIHVTNQLEVQFLKFTSLCKRIVSEYFFMEPWKENLISPRFEGNKSKFYFNL